MSADKNQDEILENRQYERGFNNGYLISKHDPALSDKLLVSMNHIKPAHEDMYLEGLKYGMLEHELEKAKEPYKHYGKQRPSSPNKNPDIDLEPTK